MYAIVPGEFFSFRLCPYLFDFIEYNSALLLGLWKMMLSKCVERDWRPLRARLWCWQTGKLFSVG